MVKYHLGWWLLAGVLFGTSAVTCIPVAQAIEHAYYPVISGFKVVKAENIVGGVLIWGTFDKDRDCKFLEATVTSGTARLDLEFKDVSNYKPHTRSVGPQVFGPWLISPVVTPVKLTVQHECHSFWRTSTEMFEGSLFPSIKD
tara:strand:+ start:329 stop:757 length:429 start_codon:yes stop_codon:yes gene_type:complete